MEPLDRLPGPVPPAAPPTPTPPAAPAASAFAGDRLVAAPGPTALAAPGPLARAWGAVAGFVRDLFQPMWRSAAYAPPTPPPDQGGLRIASYNVLLGGQRLEAAIRDLRRLDADVICLQETSRAATEAIARELGLHVAFYTPRGPLRGSLKAILSRHPIEAAADVPFDVPFAQRLGAAWTQARAGNKALWAEPLEDRSMLTARLRVGGRTIEVVDTHLGLGDPKANAAQLQQLAALVEARRKAGATVIVAGDFNAHLGLATAAGRTPPADAPGRFDTPTDTVAEYQDRYGAGPGNIARAEVAAAAARLLGAATPYWDAADRTVIVEGAPMTPEQARAELASGRVPAGTARHKQLLLAMDGVTHLGARKRFDHVLATPDVRMERAVIDQSATGSDHQPILAEVRWD